MEKITVAVVGRRFVSRYLIDVGAVESIKKIGVYRGADIYHNGRESDNCLVVWTGKQGLASKEAEVEHLRKEKERGVT